MREDMFKALDAKIMDICISTIDEVKEFVSIVSDYSCTTTLQSGKYMVDAKSLMGILSVGLANTCEVHIHSENQDVLDKFQKDIELWIVN